MACAALPRENSGPPGYPIACTARGAFLATVERGRAAARTSWDFAPDELLTHYPQAAVDRRAARDALVAHDLLHILPRHPRRTARCDRIGPGASVPAETVTSPLLAPRAGAAHPDIDPHPPAKFLAAAMLSSQSAGRIELVDIAPPMVGEVMGRDQISTGTAHPSIEQAQSSTDKMSASGQHYG
ncbi:MAG: hypothetical protein AB7I37_24775 [Pirellulales bacterium]